MLSCFLVEYTSKRKGRTKRAYIIAGTPMSAWKKWEKCDSRKIHMVTRFLVDKVNVLVYTKNIIW